uniref:Uncharacterized protein n=1 Tax=Arion vulgaris TaxID=1028688 RepID=A0A0B7AS58_9EUPU
MSSTLDSAAVDNLVNNREGNAKFRHKTPGLGWSPIKHNGKNLLLSCKIPKCVPSTDLLSQSVSREE